MIDAWRQRNPLVHMVATNYVYDLTGCMTISVVYAQHAWMHTTVSLESLTTDLTTLCDQLGLEGLKVEGGAIYGLRNRADKNDWLTLYEWIAENGNKV